MGLLSAIHRALNFRGGLEEIFYIKFCVPLLITLLQQTTDERYNVVYLSNDQSVSYGAGFIVQALITSHGTALKAETTNKELIFTEEK
jgi:hypothetical protein